MDVTLPNGQVIKGVPEGTPKDVIMQKAISAGLAKESDFTAQQPQQQLQPQQTETTIGEDIVGGLETAASFVSGAVAEPVAGVAGIAQSLNPFAEEGAGARAVEATREALTYQPETEAGIQQQQAIGEALAPVGEALSSAEAFLGESVLDLTGSPALATIAHTLPTAALELLGIKGAKRISGAPKPLTKKMVEQSILESAPEVEAIKSASRAIYKEIDESGVTIKPKSIDKLVNKIDAETRKKGLDPRVTVQASGAMQALRDIKGTAQPITELDIQRNIAQKVAGSADAGEAMLGNMMIDEIDSFMDQMSRKDLLKGDASTGKKYDAARKLWGRAKRSEMINEAITKGEARAAGAEAGIRNELNNLLNNKKKSKFIPESEKQIMRDLVKGDFKQNMTRLIGKTGISIDRSPGFFQAMMASGSAGLGGLMGLGSGGIIIPAIGSVSKQVAQKLTRNKAKFVDSMTRAGTDANKIAKAYLTSVPKAKRSVEDLADLLSDPQINLNELEMIANKTFQDAVDLAKGRRAINLAAGALSGEAGQAVKTDQQQNMRE